MIKTLEQNDVAALTETAKQAAKEAIDWWVMRRNWLKYAETEFGGKNGANVNGKPVADAQDQASSAELALNEKIAAVLFKEGVGNGIVGKDRQDPILSQVYNAIFSEAEAQIGQGQYAAKYLSGLSGTQQTGSKGRGRG